MRTLIDITCGPAFSSHSAVSMGWWGMRATHHQSISFTIAVLSLPLLDPPNVRYWLWWLVKCQVKEPCCESVLHNVYAVLKLNIGLFWPTAIRFFGRSNMLTETFEHYTERSHMPRNMAQLAVSSITTTTTSSSSSYSCNDPSWPRKKPRAQWVESSVCSCPHALDFPHWLTPRLWAWWLWRWRVEKAPATRSERVCSCRKMLSFMYCCAMLIGGIEHCYESVELWYSLNVRCDVGKLNVGC